MGLGLIIVAIGDSDKDFWPHTVERCDPLVELSPAQPEPMCVAKIFGGEVLLEERTRLSATSLNCGFLLFFEFRESVDDSGAFDYSGEIRIGDYFQH